MSEEPLLDCPFCGYPAWLWMQADNAVFVKCTNCPAQMAPAPELNALAAWNRRVVTEALPEEEGV